MYIETKRLIVRPHTPADFEDYFGYTMDEELQRMLGLNGVEDRESALETFQWLLDNVEFLALVSKESGKAVGHICVHPPDEKLADDPVFRGKRGKSLSFAMATPERRKGLMSEALETLIGKLFQEGTVDYLDCEYPLFNAASRELQKKLGFQYWGTEWLEDTELVINVLTR